MLKDPSFIYLATILPPILLGFIIWKSDKFPEPGKFLVASFLLGVSIIFPLDLFIRIAEDHIAPMFGIDLDTIKTWNEGAWKEDNAVYPAAARTFMSFFRAAFLEEGIKFALLIFFCVRLSDLNEPMDAIVYGTVVSLGFATLENFDYVYRLAEYYGIKPIDVAYARSYSATDPGERHDKYTFSSPGAAESATGDGISGDNTKS